MTADVYVLFMDFSRVFIHTLEVNIWPNMEKKGDSKGYDDEADFKGMKDYSDEMADSKGGDTEYYDDGKDTIQLDVPQVDVTDIIIEPSQKCPIGDPLELKITFILDRDVVAGYWEVKVRAVEEFVNPVNDFYHSFSWTPPVAELLRVGNFPAFKPNDNFVVLGTTKVEDYVDGESDMQFEVFKVISKFYDLHICFKLYRWITSTFLAFLPVL